MLRYIGREIARSFSFMRENSAFCFARPKVAWIYAFGRSTDRETVIERERERESESESVRARAIAKGESKIESMRRSFVVLSDSRV